MGHLDLAVAQVSACGVQFTLDAQHAPAELAQFLATRRQLALGPRRPRRSLIQFRTVALSHLGLLVEVPAIHLGHRVVVLLIARLQFAAAPFVGPRQFGRLARGRFFHVALALCFGGSQLVFRAAAQGLDFVLVVALLGLQSRFMGLALGRKLG